MIDNLNLNAAYRALASPSLIALSNKDPILTAFELSWQLRRLSFLEPEFKTEYLELRKQCQSFATALLDHTRTTHELEVLLNHDPATDSLEAHGKMTLSRLKLAIRCKQKKFCAHANVQQLLASIWYEGLPGFRRKNIVVQTLQILLIGFLFPVLSLAYILAPCTRLGQVMKKPFIKFICHSASYMTFLGKLPSPYEVLPSPDEWRMHNGKMLVPQSHAEIRSGAVSAAMFRTAPRIQRLTSFMLHAFAFVFAFLPYCSIFVFPRRLHLADHVLLSVHLPAVLLALASQRIETDIFDFDISNGESVTKRGSPPTLIELLVLPWVLGQCSLPCLV